ncbi:hypothetical protein BC831DRAFT_58285 [Entophlyctis helioformis]|nr:hypothetical protein BC831DRAFT_58285 [Entophlyctis helioformis]
MDPEVPTLASAPTTETAEAVAVAPAGVLRIKAQYRVPIAPSQDGKRSRDDANDGNDDGDDQANADDDDAEAAKDNKRQRTDTGNNSNNKRKGGRGQNKAKDRQQAAKSQADSSAIKLCNNIVQGSPCERPNCRFSHDMAAFLAAKGPDLGPACPQYDLYGACKFGLKCRYAGAHTDADGKQTTKDVVLPDDTYIKNVVGRDGISRVRKRDMDQGRSDEFIKWWEEIGSKENEVKHLADAAERRKKKTVGAADAPVDGADGEGETDAKAEAGVTAEDKTETKTVIETEDKTEAEAETLTHKDKLERIENAAGGTDIRLRPCEKKRIDFRNKTYLAPLTTVGNLPFRRICKGFGVDITCGEMALSAELLKGSSNEWALLRRHVSEDLFGVQLAGNHPVTFTRCVEAVSELPDIDFIDLNLGCPVDSITAKGCGSALMDRRNKLRGMVMGAVAVSPVPITVKMRMGISDKTVNAHKLVPMLRECGVGAIAVHGRTKNQRYTKSADWDYIVQCGRVNRELDALAAARGFGDGGGGGGGGGRTAFFGNGDIMSPQEYWEHMDAGVVAAEAAASADVDSDVGGKASSAAGPSGPSGSDGSVFDGLMIGRGALIKPWLFREIKTRQLYDISSRERLDILRDFAHHGLETWGSDTQGISTTRRFMCEWLSFLYRYVPVGLIEVLPQRINERPERFFGRDELETLMASSRVADWIKITEMVLGPAHESFVFMPKHKSNSYDGEAQG